MLRSRKAIEVGQEGCHKLMQPGEAELHFRLDPERPHDTEIGRRTHGALQKGGLTDAGLATEYECPAHPHTHGFEQSVERRRLVNSIDERAAVDSSAYFGRCSYGLRGAHGAPPIQHRTPKVKA